MVSLQHQRPSLATCALAEIRVRQMLAGHFEDICFREDKRDEEIIIEKKAGRGPEKLKRKQPGSGPKNREKKQPGRGPEHLFVWGSRCQQAGEVYPARGSLTRKGKMWWSASEKDGGRKEQKWKRRRRERR